MTWTDRLIAVSIAAIPIGFGVAKAGGVSVIFKWAAAGARATFNCAVWWPIWWREEKGKLEAWGKEASDAGMHQEN